MLVVKVLSKVLSLSASKAFHLEQTTVLNN